MYKDASHKEILKICQRKCREEYRELSSKKRSELTSNALTIRSKAVNTTIINF